MQEIHIQKHCSKDAERQRQNLESSIREALYHMQRSSIKVTADYLAKPTEVGRQWNNTFKVQKELHCQERTIYPAKCPSTVKKK